MALEFSFFFFNREKEDMDLGKDVHKLTVWTPEKQHEIWVLRLLQALFSFHSLHTEQ